MKVETSRFDTRLPKEQKEFFEYAASLGGYRTLTEFVLATVQIKADEIVKRHYSIIASKRDQKIFFEAVINPPAPGKKLVAAAKKYRKIIGEK